MTDEVEDQKHITEDEFTDIVETWWEDQVGVENVSREVYQPGPYWFVDLIVNRPEVDWYIEIENDRESIRDGVGQALGYASDYKHGEPMIIVPAGHTAQSEVEALRKSQAVLVREFDTKNMEFIK